MIEELRAVLTATIEVPVYGQVIVALSMLAVGVAMYALGVINTTERILKRD